MHGPYEEGVGTHITTKTVVAGTWTYMPAEQLVEFGEGVMYYTSDITGARTLESRWESGIWFGLRDETNEAIIGTPGGCIKSRDARRYGTEEEKWGQDNSCR